MYYIHGVKFTMENPKIQIIKKVGYNINIMDHTITDIVKIFKDISSELLLSDTVNLHIVYKSQSDLDATPSEFKLSVEEPRISLINKEKYRIDTNGPDGVDEWLLLSQLGFCGYCHSNTTVYISYPYTANQGVVDDEKIEKMDSTEILPLERAIRHELGHSKQYNEFPNNFSSINKTILEYHNIIFNENESKAFFGTDSFIGRKQCRLTYSNTPLMGKSLFMCYDKKKLKTSINYTDNIIHACCIEIDNKFRLVEKINEKINENNVSGIIFNSQDLELYKRISNKLIDNPEDCNLQLLFVNMLNELKFID